MAGNVDIFNRHGCEDCVALLNGEMEKERKPFPNPFPNPFGDLLANVSANATNATNRNFALIPITGKKAFPVRRDDILPRRNR